MVMIWKLYENILQKRIFYASLYEKIEGSLVKCGLINKPQEDSLIKIEMEEEFVIEYVDIDELKLKLQDESIWDKFL